MKTTQQSLSAAGVAPWIEHDYYPTPANITLAGYVSSGASLTWAVQYTVDPLSSGEYAHPVSVSQATTTITVTDTFDSNGHGLSVGDYVKLFGTRNAGVDGEYSVASVTSATVYTVTSGTSQSFSGIAQVVSARVFTHSVLTGQTGRMASNYAWPVRASRLQITTYASGVATLRVLQGGQAS